MCYVLVLNALLITFDVRCNLLRFLLVHPERNMCYASSIRVIYLVILAYAEVKGVVSLRGDVLNRHIGDLLLRWNC